MKKLAMFMVLAFVVVATTGCVGCTRIGPGYAGIVVNLAGDERGVNEIPVETGWLWYNPFTQQVMEYPTHVQTHTWTKDQREQSPVNEQISFNSKDGMQITADISLSYRIEAASVPAPLPAAGRESATWSGAPPPGRPPARAAAPVEAARKRTAALPARRRRRGTTPPPSLPGILRRHCRPG